MSLMRTIGMGTGMGKVSFTAGQVHTIYRGTAVIVQTAAFGVGMARWVDFFTTVQEN
jgi:hypothetical protein